jgi:uncharacterized protein YegL
MRRLPIYFLIDISESMVGEQIQLVEEGLAGIIKSLKENPYALETVHLSIIVFAGQPQTLIPLQDVITFYPPKFPVGGGTSLSNGLGHLMYEMRRSIIKTTSEQKGDWKPIVFLFTDGVPTDDTTAAITEWRTNWGKQANMVAISFGEETDLGLLRQLTDNVFLFKNSTVADYKKFFEWVTASIAMSSLSVDSGSTGFELAKVNDDVMEKVNENTKVKQYADPNFVVIAGRCSDNKRPYLLKYQRMISNSDFDGLQLGTLKYKFRGAYPIAESYFQLSEGSAINETINTEELEGFPTCPCCANPYSFAMCGMCHKIHCIAGEGACTCPWCGSQGRYGAGEGGMDVGRAQG